jgi:hypothetical protein
MLAAGSSWATAVHAAEAPAVAVTNCRDDGEGSLRAAVAQAAARSQAHA